MSRQRPASSSRGFASPDTGSTWGRRQVAGLTLLVVTGLGCDPGGGRGPGSGSSPNGSHSLPPVGRPDQIQSLLLRIVESDVVGTVGATGQLQLQIPLANSGIFAASGALTATIASVDGQKTFDSRRVPYVVGAGQTTRLTAQLAVPPGVVAQPDWSTFNVVVEGGAQGLRMVRSLLTVVGAYDVELEGPAAISTTRTASYRVRAQNPTTHLPLVGVKVGLVVRSGGAIVATYQGETGDKGDAIFDVALDQVGDVVVEATGATQGTTTVISDGAKVEAPGSKVLLTTDKPIYQPGQIIHLRALALDQATQAPLGGQPAVFEIQDGKGNKICKRTFTTDTYGLASTDFQLGQVLNLGTFQASVQVGADTAMTVKSVTVSRYALPKFKLDVAPDKPWYTPGQTVGGTVDAHYFFGKPAAAADVIVEASTLDIGQTTFARVIGKTDSTGRYAFQVGLPTGLVGLPIQQGSGLVNLHVTVTDSAGQVVTQDQSVTVAARGLRLALIPESTVLIPGLPNRLNLFVTDPLGNPVAGAKVDFSTDAGGGASGTTDAFGQAAFDWTPPAPGAGASIPGGGGASGGATDVASVAGVAGVASVGLVVHATTTDGLSVTEPFMLDLQGGGSHVLVRTDAAVYGLGDTVSVDITTSPDQSTVYVDWLNNGQDVEMQTLDVENGRAHFTKTVDTGLVGSNRIDAYVVDPGGNIVRSGRTVFVRERGGLSVDLATDQPEYTPGAPATLTLSVKDETGAPAVAALGVQIVDQAVFALVDARPGLLQTYFQLDAAFAQPTYQIRPPAVDVTQLLFQDTAQADPTGAAAAQVRAAATFAALGTSPPSGINHGSWQALAPSVKQQLRPFYDAAKLGLGPTVTRAANDAIAALTTRGCPATSYYCSSQQMPYLQALQQELATRVEAYDFWGNAYLTSQTGSSELLRLTTSGPDEQPGNADDDSIVFIPSDLTLPIDASVLGGGNFGGVGPGAAGPAAGIPAGGNAMGVGAVATGSASASAPTTTTGGTAADAAPRVRQDFPETLYVNPELITGPDGKATVTLNMADSITDWRVSTLAHTQLGKLGGGVGSVRVFQDFFVDVDFPATLTRGDQVEFPIAIYNYLATPQTVHIALAPGTWYTPLGATAADVSLDAGQVTGIRFPVRVDAVGRQTLTVQATGGARSDAVARSVVVQPDGMVVPVAQSGSLQAGTLARTVVFPSNAIAGSEQLYVDVFPAYLSQVVQGMDSMLQVPNGCFEQTTSTAWPNVLVTDYLRQTGQLEPDVQLKAESLMSAGYQRLLTFEHAGGGFSWFGEQDPMPFLSVTAFGLMEFSDMAKVQTVDPAMLDRTTRWLLGQQAADGSWAGDMSEFFSFQTSLVRNTAFVVWALASSGYQGPELAHGLGFVEQGLGAMGLAQADAYSLGIVANAFLAAAPGDPFGAQVLSQLVAIARPGGAGGASTGPGAMDGSGGAGGGPGGPVSADTVSWDTGGTQTNFYSQGYDGAVATTALAVQALLTAGGYKDLVDKGLAFLIGSRDAAGNFGSTQATIWTLRALVLAAKVGTTPAVGTLGVGVDGTSFAPVLLTADRSDLMTTVDLASLATVGTHAVTLTFAGTGKVSYNLVSRHNIPWTALPPPSSSGPLSVSVAYDKTSIALDQTVAETVTLRNNTRTTENMILVTVGIPPGFAVVTGDLDTYETQQLLSSYELTARQLVLYVSSLKPSVVQTFVYHLQATMPVKASDGGTVASLYYQPDQKTTAPATTLEVLSPTGP
jgi:hypothetical protein